MTPAIVIVAFGAPTLLREALQPVTGLDVVVVDNSSSSDVRAACAAMGARYIDPGRNLGFATALNLGVRKFEQGRDVLVLNPDAVLDSTGIERLQAALHADPRTAAVAPRLIGPGGEQRPGWPWPSPRGMWREAIGMARDTGRHDFLVGAALLLRGTALRDVGPFDERFFLYAEETDWQHRAVAQGWEVQVVPGVVAHHHGAGTSTDAPRREALFHAGTETYVRKWFGRRGWLSYRAAALLGALLRSALPGSRGAAARRRARLYARGPRRVAGIEA